MTNLAIATETIQCNLSKTTSCLDQLSSELNGMLIASGISVSQPEVSQFPPHVSPVDSGISNSNNNNNFRHSNFSSSSNTNNRMMAQMISNPNMHYLVEAKSALGSLFQGN